jgi:adenylyltransferase/sulfurtransferase
MTPEISCKELKAAFDRGDNLVLLDVRESFELEISRFDDLVEIPMDEVMSRIGELDKDADIVVVCRTGNRSSTITDMLISAGFKTVRNMAGGMNEWADTIDPSVSKY